MSKVWHLAESTLIPFTALTYSLLTPLILPVAAFTFGVANLCYRYTLLYLSDIKVETQGKLYFPAVFSLFFGVYTYQATIIGLFILKFDGSNQAHDLAQLSILVLTLVMCTQFHLRLKRLYEPWIRHGDVLKSSIDDFVEEQQDTDSLDIRPRLEPPSSSSEDGVFRWFNTTIWLPKDPFSISTHLIHEVRTKVLSGQSAEIQITDSSASMTNEGHVQLDNYDSTA